MHVNIVGTCLQARNLKHHLQHDSFLLASATINIQICKYESTTKFPVKTYKIRQ